MANLPVFDKGSERFKRNMKKVTDLGDDHEARITKLEKGGSGRELEFNGCENGLEATFWIRARRGTAAV